MTFAKTSNGQKGIKMKIRNQEVRGFLIILLVAQAINAIIFVGLQKTQAQLGDYIYSQTAQPFLAQPPVTKRASKIEITINKLKK